MQGARTVFLLVQWSRNGEQLGGILDVRHKSYPLILTTHKLMLFFGMTLSLPTKSKYKAGLPGQLGEL